VDIFLAAGLFCPEYVSTFHHVESAVTHAMSIRREIPHPFADFLVEERKTRQKRDNCLREQIKDIVGRYFITSK